MAGIEAWEGLGGEYQVILKSFCGPRGFCYLRPFVRSTIQDFLVVGFRVLDKLLYM